MMHAEMAMKQATSTAQYYLSQAIEDIDLKLGKGYARSNPALIAAYIQVCAQDYHTAVIAGAVEDTVQSVQKDAICIGG